MPLDPFAAALDAIYRAPGSVAAVYTPAGGSARTVRIIRTVNSVDTPGGFPDGGRVYDRNVVKIRVSDVAMPELGDTIAIGAETLVVNEAPMLDAEGLEWTFGVEPA